MGSLGKQYPVSELWEHKAFCSLQREYVPFESSLVWNLRRTSSVTAISRSEPSSGERIHPFESSLVWNVRQTSCAANVMCGKHHVRQTSCVKHSICLVHEFWWTNVFIFRTSAPCHSFSPSHARASTLSLFLSLALFITLSLFLSLSLSLSPSLSLP